MKIHIHNADNAAFKLLAEKLYKTHQLTGTLNSISEHPYLDKIIEPTEISDALIASDVIIYRLSDSLSDVKDAIRILEGTLYKGEKVFVCVSSYMTWALTKRTFEDEEEDDGEEKDPNKPKAYEAFSEDQVLKRKAHFDFREYLEVEKRVKQAQSKTLRPIVVFEGLEYGIGEDYLHPLFRDAWEGKEPLKVYGDGYNYVPMIHVRDAASIIKQLIETPPENDEEDQTSCYIFAADEAHSNQRQIVEAVSKEFGDGEIVFLSENESRIHEHYSELMADVKFKLGVVEGFEDMEWHCKEGFVAKIKMVRREFEIARRLDALRICIFGPPGSGKSYYSSALAKHYKITHVQIQQVIDEYFAQIPEFEKAVADLTPPPKEKKEITGEDGEEEEEPEEEPEEEEEDEEGTSPLSKAKKRLKQILQLKAKVDENGRYKDEVLAAIYRWKLTQRKLRNQGWILDGFPKTVSQCQLLMKKPPSEDEEEEEEEDAEGKADPLMMPEYVIQIHMNERLLRKRLSKLSPEEVKDTHNTRDDFNRRLELYNRHNSRDENGVLAYVEELIRPDEKQPLTKEIQVKSVDEDVNLFVNSVIEFIGAPHNYGTTRTEIEEQQKQEYEQSLREKAQQEKEEKEEVEKIQVEKSERAQQLNQQKDRVSQMKQEQEIALKVKAEPLRSYLGENILPVLTKGLIEVVQTKPEDPVDWLATYLYNANPNNHKISD